MQLVDSSTENRAEAPGQPVSSAPFQDIPPSSSRAGAPAAPEETVSQEELVSGQEGGYPVWRIACGDMINRDRCIAVYVDGGEVVVVGPPGESARLGSSQLAELRKALDEAAKLAER